MAAPTPSPTLAEVQRWMAARILPGGAFDPSAVALNPQRGAPGADRLAVYAEGYLVRTEAALADVYETVRHLLGRAAFCRLAQAYVRVHPSREPNITFVGRAFPEWLAAQPSSTELPFLPDLARLEWLVCEAVHAPERAPLRLDALAGLSPAEWERARFAVQPSIGQLASAWPILDLWQARTQPREAINVDLRDRPQRVLVSRVGAEVRCEPLDEAPFRLLEALRRGAPLGEMCAGWHESPGAAASDPGAWLGRWARQGLLVECRTK
jgi:hypothetical protein